MNKTKCCLYKDWHCQRPILSDNIGFMFICVKMCEIQITMKIYKYSDCIEQKVIREGCVNLSGEDCLGLCKVPIESSRVKGKYRHKNYKNP